MANLLVEIASDGLLRACITLVLPKVPRQDNATAVNTLMGSDETETLKLMRVVLHHQGTGLLPLAPG